MTEPEGPTTAHNDEFDDKIINWKEEATAIINDVKFHVDEIVISDKLPNNDTQIYLNVRTKEGTEQCVHVSSLGFRVVSHKYDTIDAAMEEVADEHEFYDTPYALLDKISPSYVQSFGNQLCKQLQQLQQMRTQFNEEDEEGLEEEEEDDDDGDDDDELKKVRKQPKRM